MPSLRLWRRSAIEPSSSSTTVHSKTANRQDSKEFLRHYPFFVEHEPRSWKARCRRQHRTVASESHGGGVDVNIVLRDSAWKGRSPRMVEEWNWLDWKPWDSPEKLRTRTRSAPSAPSRCRDPAMLEWTMNRIPKPSLEELENLSLDEEIQARIGVRLSPSFKPTSEALSVPNLTDEILPSSIPTPAACGSGGEDCGLMHSHSCIETCLDREGHRVLRSRRYSRDPPPIPQPPSPVRRLRTQFGIGPEKTFGEDDDEDEEYSDHFRCGTAAPMIPLSLFGSPSSLEDDLSATSHSSHSHGPSIRRASSSKNIWPFLHSSASQGDVESTRRRSSVLRRMSSTSLRRNQSHEPVIAPPVLGVITRRRSTMGPEPICPTVEDIPGLAERSNLQTSQRRTILTVTNPDPGVFMPPLAGADPKRSRRTNSWPSTPLDAVRMSGEFRKEPFVGLAL
ncbi:hypothetical protein P7C70_g1454, partial [Phenoliferia sp. Uapishka_3]